MNIERIKSDVALHVAEKTGITTEQSSVILDNVIGPPSAHKTLSVYGLEVRIINRKVPDFAHMGLKIFDCPYETVAEFHVGQDLHEIVFLGLDRALSDPAGQVEFVEQGGK